MTVLVAFASKYGSTREIAEVIGETLSNRGVDVTVADVGEVGGLDEYEAVVLGSAVYAGRWLKEASRFVEEHGEALASRRVWLFSSGPVGDPPKPEEDPVAVGGIAEDLGAEDHRVFPGRLSRDGLTFGDRAITMALRAPQGDFRDWDGTRAWAAEIADTMLET